MVKQLSRRQEISILGLLTLTSLSIQFLFMRIEPSGPDSNTYITYAQEIVNRADLWTDPKAFQDNYWPFLYSLFLAAVEKTFGLSAVSIHFFHSVLFVGTIIGIWWLVRNQSSPIRICTTGFLIVSPVMIVSTRNTGYELLLAFFITISIVLVVSIRENVIDSRSMACAASFLAGALMGLAILTSSRTLIIGFVAFVFLGIRHRLSALLFAMGTAIPLLIWAVRNFLVRGQFSFLTTNGPINVWIGSNPDATTGGYMAPPVTPHGYVEGAILFFKQDPAKFVELFFRRTTFFWGPVGPEVGATGVIKISFVTFGLFVALVTLLGFLGWWFARILLGGSTLRELQIPAWCALAYFLVSVPFLMLTRYRFPIEPLLVAVAIPTIFFYTRTWANRRALNLHEPKSLSQVEDRRVRK